MKADLFAHLMKALTGQDYFPLVAHSEKLLEPPHAPKPPQTIKRMYELLGVREVELPLYVEEPS